MNMMNLICTPFRPAFVRIRNTKKNIVCIYTCTGNGGTSAGVSIKMALTASGYTILYIETPPPLLSVCQFVSLSHSNCRQCN